MKYHELNTSSNRTRKRVGRGIAAGGGKTAGRGTKGQSARSGGKVRPGFEGGQNPLSQRIPKKRGFTSKRTPKEVVYTHQLEEVTAKKIDALVLFDANIVKNPYAGVKLVLKGELTKAVSVELQGATKGARELIKKAGGTFTEVPAPQRTKKK